MSQLVRGLPVPTLLVDLLATHRWKHSGNDIIRRAVPCISDPLDFLSSTERMDFESGSLNLEADPWMHEFHGRNAENRSDGRECASLGWRTTNSTQIVKKRSN